MAAMARTMLGVMAVLALVSQTQANTLGNPINKVVKLLKKLAHEVTTEGKKEAADYDKFACYCKEQADDTLYAVTKSKKLIAALDAQISKLDADIQELHGAQEDGAAGAIFDLTTKITLKTDNIKTAVDNRKAANDAYILAATELADAITAIEGAIASIKGKKAGVKDGKMQLLQDKLLEVLTTRTPTETQLSLVQALGAEEGTPQGAGNAHAYNYKSGGILGTLDNLLKEFKAKKKVANMEEKDSLFAFESKKLALENERKFAQEDKVEKQKLLANLQGTRTKATGDRTTERADKASDDSYMTALTADCEAKAEAWDTRSKTRSDELTAISQALEQLTKKGGVSDNYGSSALTMLQVGRHNNAEASEAVISKAMALISTQGNALNSAILKGLAVQMSLSKGFGAVQKLLDDLIKKLQAEATAENGRKGQCDIDMGLAVDKRDTNKLKSEDASATIAMKTAAIKALRDQIGDLQASISKLTKAKLEATELRVGEKADNEKTIADATAGKEAVDAAITSLKAFYDGAFVQVGAPGDNRAGVSVGDGDGSKANFKTYEKNSAGTGVIGILEVILNDFASTITNTGNTESESASSFTEYETNTQKDIDDKNGVITTKEGEITAAKADITQAKDNMSDADKAFALALVELEEVTAMCMTGEGSFAERKKQREDEIKALQDAKVMLKSFSDNNA